MAKYWIIPRVGDKELPRVGHQLASCSLLISYVLSFLSIDKIYKISKDTPSLPSSFPPSLHS